MTRIGDRLPLGCRSVAVLDSFIQDVLGRHTAATDTSPTSATSTTAAAIPTNVTAATDAHVPSLVPPVQTQTRS